MIAIHCLGKLGADSPHFANPPGPPPRPRAMPGVNRPSDNRPDTLVGQGSRSAWDSARPTTERYEAGYPEGSRSSRVRESLHPRRVRGVRGTPRTLRRPLRTLPQNGMRPGIWRVRGVPGTPRALPRPWRNQTIARTEPREPRRRRERPERSIGGTSLIIWCAPPSPPLPRCHVSVRSILSFPARTRIRAWNS